MARTKTLLPRPIPLGDAAVDGLLGGVAAGAIMAVYLVATGLLAGVGPGQVLARFDLGSTASPLAGALAHLAVAGVYGALFGLLLGALTRRWHMRRPRAWLAGLIYGLILLAVANAIVLPSQPALAAITPLNWLAAHVVYGVSLGWLFERTLN